MSIKFKKKTPTSNYVALPFRNRTRYCAQCEKDAAPLDYKDIKTLQKYVSPRSKIGARRNNSFCNKHQQALKISVKRARFVALMAYVFLEG